MHWGIYNGKKALSCESLPEWVALCAEWVQAVFWLLMLTAKEGQCAPPALLACSWDPSCHHKAVLKKVVMYPFHPSHFFEVSWDKAGCPVSQPLHRKVWWDNAVFWLSRTAVTKHGNFDWPWGFSQWLLGLRWLVWISVLRRPAWYSSAWRMHRGG